METTGSWRIELQRYERARAWRWPIALVLLAQIFSSAGSWAQGVTPERRIALVIGNSAYRKAPLVNPINDAQAMATTLEALGFAVTKLENASKAQMSDAIRTFGEQLKLGGVGLFFFAGHGLQINGENFLLPVDDDIQEKSQVATKGVEARAVLQVMNQAKNHLNVVILDACRNNPFGATRGLVATGHPDGVARSDGAGGLAPMETLANTLIAFATAPDSVAADGSGKNGVYTAHLLQHITEPGLKIEDVFKRTRFTVLQETGGRQVPWENSSLVVDFYFVPPSATGAASSGVARQPVTPGREQHAALQPSRSDSGVARPAPRSPSGFSFAREEEKDRAAQFAKEEAIRSRLRTPCPDALRRHPIVIEITEESRSDGLVTTERSAHFAQLVNQHLQQAGLTTTLASTAGRPAAASAGRASRSQGAYAIQGVVFSQQGASRLVRLQEASVNAELALRDPTGRIIAMVEVSGERYAGQGASAAARALTKEQASDASSQLYVAFCSSGIDTGRPGR